MLFYFRFCHKHETNKYSKILAQLLKGAVTSWRTSIHPSSIHASAIHPLAIIHPSIRHPSIAHVCFWPVWGSRWIQWRELRTHTGTTCKLYTQRPETNPQPSCCEATVRTTAPLCRCQKIKHIHAETTRSVYDWASWLNQINRDGPSLSPLGWCFLSALCPAGFLEGTKTPRW